MKKLLSSILIVAASFCSFTIIAKPLPAEVKISELKNVKLSDYFVDQIYFTVLEIDNQGKTKVRRIPEYPLETPMKKNHSLKNISLWKKELNPGDSYQVIVTVAEQDVSKFGVDDLIGQAAVTFSHDGNKLVTTWAVPTTDRKNTTKFIGKKDLHLFEMTGSKGQYEVTFSR